MQKCDHFRIHQTSPYCDGLRGCEFLALQIAASPCHPRGHLVETLLLWRAIANAYEEPHQRQYELPIINCAGPVELQRYLRHEKSTNYDDTGLYDCPFVRVDVLAP